MITCSFSKYTLQFKFEAGTSRGVLTEKDSFFVKVSNEKTEGIGEAAPLKGLSIDFLPNFEFLLSEKIDLLNQTIKNKPLNSFSDITNEMNTLNLNDLPSVRFAFETALLDFINGGKKQVFKCEFNKGKPLLINGLVWMGEKDFMLTQIKEKINAGFTCVKMKVGAIDLEKEFELLHFIRKQYSKNDIELRVDANGAFNPNDALDILKAFSKYDIHSIEQPIKQGQIEQMAQLCEETPLPIALDEELIGIAEHEAKKQLLHAIKPHYIILKPTLIGGFFHSEEWIKLAEKQGIGWWMTSALESNIGLNAIAQFTSNMYVKIPQGLGTGSVFLNNIPMPLMVENGYLIKK